MIISRLYGFIWDVPFLVGIVSCFLMFPILYSEELRRTRLLTKNQVSFLGVWNEKTSLFDGAFGKNIVVMFSRGGILMMVEFLWIGGAGSLFWFLVFGLMTVSVRYVQTIILCKNRLRGKLGFEFAVLRSIGEKRHFKSAKVMARLGKVSMTGFLLLLPQLFFVTYTIKSVTRIGFGMVLVGLALSIIIYGLISDVLRARLIKICIVLIITYVIVLFVGVVKDVKMATLAIEAGFKDAFQMDSFVGEVMNRGWTLCVGMGAAMGLYVGNFAFDDCIKSMGKEESSFEKLGGKVMLASMFQVFFVCFLTGIIGLMSYISSANVKLSSTYEFLTLYNVETLVAVMGIALSGIVGAYEDVGTLYFMLPMNLRGKIDKNRGMLGLLTLSVGINFIIMNRGLSVGNWIELIMIVLFFATLINIFLIFSGVEDYRKALRNKD